MREASDLFQFYYDSTPIKGTLDTLLEKIDKQAIKRAIRIGVCTIYYVRIHNFIHEKNEDILRSLYKSAVFVLQAIWFLETGKYIKLRIELQKAINPPSAVLTTAQELKSGASIQFEEMSEILLHWTKTVIVKYKE